MAARKHDDPTNAETDSAESTSAQTTTVPTTDAVPLPDGVVFAGPVGQPTSSGNGKGHGGGPTGSPVQPTRPDAPGAGEAKRATFNGNVAEGEYLTPLLIAERDADGNITERIFYTPGRDLTESEWQGMDPRHKEYVRKSKAYTVDSDATVKRGRGQPD